jgi:hypothetical protein
MSTPTGIEANKELVRTYTQQSSTNTAPTALPISSRAK